MAITICSECGRTTGASAGSGLFGVSRRPDVTDVPANNADDAICARCRSRQQFKRFRKSGGIILGIVIGLLPFAIQTFDDDDAKSKDAFVEAENYTVPLTPPAKGEEAVPAGNPGTWVRPEDYPAAALRDEREGMTMFDLRVDRYGVPFLCAISTSSGSDDLDRATCAALLERARFEPTPNGTLWSNRVRWEIPR